jgi:hypothetical protein
MIRPLPGGAAVVAVALAGSAALGCSDDAGGTGAGGGGGAGATTSTGDATPAATTGSSAATSSTTGNAATTSISSTGAGGADPRCEDGGVDDAFTFEGLGAPMTAMECQVAAVTPLPDWGLDLICGSFDEAFDASLRLSTSGPVATVTPWIEEGDSVLVDTFIDEEFPGFDASVVVRSNPEGFLLFAWVEDFSVDPHMAPSDWASPLSVELVEGVCPSVDDTEHQALDVEAPDGLKTRVFSRHAAVIDTELGEFEVRARGITSNPEVDGGCNDCVYYAILAVP